MGFETAIWHFRSATSCFYWASQLLSGTCSAPIKTLKNRQNPRSSFRRPFAALPWSCFCWASKLLSGTSEAPQTVSIGLRNCYLARFQHPLKPSKPCKTLAAAFDGLSLLCHGSSRGPTSSFCWALKLLSGTSEAPQAVSIRLRNCYLAHFQHSLKPSKASPSKPSKTLPAAVDGLSLLCHGPRDLPKPHELFLLGFETAIWHFRSATNCFYWASKLLAGTFSAPLKTVKTLKTLAAAFAEAPQAVSIGLRNCYLARFQHPLKPTKPSKPSQQLSTAFRCFAMGPPTSCFCWASKLLSGTSEAPQAVSSGLRNC